MLAERGTWFRKLGRRLFLVGFYAAIFAVVVVWPDQGASGTLAKTELLVPADLAPLFRNAGVLIGLQPVSLMEPAEQSTRLQFGLLPIALWLVWRAIGYFNKSWTLRVPVLFFGWLSVFTFIGIVINDPTLVSTVTAGHVSARAGQAVPSEKSDGSKQPLLPIFRSIVPPINTPEGARLRGTQSTTDAGSDDHARTLLAYHLEPGRLGPTVADQARFVLAQQAYHEERPRDVAAQLRAMTGAWKPNDGLSQTIVGVLVDYAGASRYDVGAVAPQIAHGRPHQALRWAMAGWAMRLAALLALVGIALDLLGWRRARAAKGFRAALDMVSDRALATNSMSLQHSIVSADTPIRF